jgi:hypothetical protein
VTAQDDRAHDEQPALNLHDFVPSLRPDVCAECTWHRADPSQHSQPDPAPVDWPARFRAAAEAAPGDTHLADVANDLERLPPHVVKAIGRALLGEDRGRSMSELRSRD